jgi:dTMP kinase
MSRGEYIVLEGLDGMGKTTQAAMLSETIGATALREPGGGKIGEAIRDLLIDPENTFASTKTEVLLHTAQRIELIESIVRPTVESGKHVVADRCWWSTYAYQGAQGADVKLIENVTELAIPDFIKPNLILFLDGDPAVGVQRQTGQKADRYEQMGKKFFESVRRNYHVLAMTSPNAVVIDAEQSRAAVHDQIRETVRERLGVYV